MCLLQHVATHRSNHDIHVHGSGTNQKLYFFAVLSLSSILCANQFYQIQLLHIVSINSNLIWPSYMSYVMYRSLVITNNQVQNSIYCNIVQRYWINTCNHSFCIYGQRQRMPTLFCLIDRSKIGNPHVIPSWACKSKSHVPGHQYNSFALHPWSFWQAPVKLSWMHHHPHKYINYV